MKIYCRELSHQGFAVPIHKLIALINTLQHYDKQPKLILESVLISYSCTLWDMIFP